MKKNNIEFTVGGFILIALFILIAGIMWLKNATVTNSMVNYTVLFSNIGTLSVGDPVKVNGVQKGTVKNIDLKGVHVEVVIDLDKDVPLTESSSIMVQNIGLMGERMIGIQLMEKGKRLMPSKKGKITYINGFYDSGIAEAMGMVGTVMTDVRSLLGNVSAIIDSTVGDTAFIHSFRSIVRRLDTVTVLAQSLVKDNRSKIDQSISNVTILTTDIKQLLDSNKTQLSAIVSDGNKLSSKAVRIVEKVDSLSTQLQSMVARIQRGDGAVGLLLNDNQFPKDLKKTVAVLDSLIGDVRDDGLKLKLHVDLFGTPKKKAPR